MIVQIVRWTSALTDEDVRALFDERSHHYRAVPGLVQKFYLRYRNGEHGAVYLWESDEALQAFRASDLGRGMANLYRIEGDKDVRLADVLLTLRPEPAR